MIHRTLSIALVLGLCVGASAQVAPPGSQPERVLPAGHPAIPAATAPDAPANLPAGHPDVSGVRKPIAHGSLNLRAIQGTAGGTKLAGDPVVIDFYSAAPTPQHFEGKLDANGVWNLPNITIPGACQPLIKVTHAGVDYQGIGQVMDAEHTGQQVEVKVFDTTDVAPQWSMKMRHVIIHRSPAGLEVTEMLMLNSPGDHVWRGAADPSGSRITLDLPLPASAQNIQFGDGLKGGGAIVKEGRLINTAPLIPGDTQVQFSYTLPVVDGKSQIAINAPVPVGHLMMFVPDDGSTVTGEGLIAAGAGNAAGGTMRFFMVASMPAGKVLKVEFTHLAAPAAKVSAEDVGVDPVAPVAPDAVPPTATEPVQSSSSIPTIVGVGSGALLVGGTIFIFARSTANKRA